MFKDYYASEPKVSSNKPFKIQFLKVLKRPASYLYIIPLTSGTINVRLNGGNIIELDNAGANKELEITPNKHHLTIFELEITTSSTTEIPVWILAS